MEFLEPYRSLIFTIVWGVGITATMAAVFSGPFKRLRAENLDEPYDTLFRFLAGSFMAGFGLSFGVLAVVNHFRTEDDPFSEILAGVFFMIFMGLFGLIGVGQLRPRHFRLPPKKRGAEQQSISLNNFSDERKAHEFVWSHLSQAERDGKWNEQQSAKHENSKDPFDH